MDQKIFNNILLLFVILVLIKFVSPEPDSVLFIIKKYINFIIYKIKTLVNYIFNCNINTENFIGTTFSGIDKFKLKAPIFPSAYQNYWVEYITNKNQLVTPKIAQQLYTFIENLVTIDSDDYFISSSNTTQNNFTPEQLIKIQNVILQKINSGPFKFTNFNFIKKPVYYNNFSGKEVEAFTFSVDCSENIGNIIIYIELSIRYDIIQKFEFISIKKIRIIFNTPFKINKNANVNTINLDSLDTLETVDNPYMINNNTTNQNKQNNTDNKNNQNNQTNIDKNELEEQNNFNIDYGLDNNLNIEMPIANLIKKSNYSSIPESSNNFISDNNNSFIPEKSEPEPKKSVPEALDNTTPFFLKDETFNY